MLPPNLDTLKLTLMCVNCTGDNRANKRSNAICEQQKCSTNSSCIYSPKQFSLLLYQHNQSYKQWFYHDILMYVCMYVCTLTIPTTDTHSCPQSLLPKQYIFYFHVVFKINLSAPYERKQDIYLILLNLFNIIYPVPSNFQEMS